MEKQNDTIRQIVAELSWSINRLNFLKICVFWTLWLFYQRSVLSYWSVAWGEQNPASSRYCIRCQNPPGWSGVSPLLPRFTIIISWRLCSLPAPRSSPSQRGCLCWGLQRRSGCSGRSRRPADESAGWRADKHGCSLRRRCEAFWRPAAFRETERGGRREEARLPLSVELVSFLVNQLPENLFGVQHEVFSYRCFPTQTAAASDQSWRISAEQWMHWKSCRIQLESE